MDFYLPGIPGAGLDKQIQLQEQHVRAHSLSWRVPLAVECNTDRQTPINFFYHLCNIVGDFPSFPVPQPQQEVGGKTPLSEEIPCCHQN